LLSTLETSICVFMLCLWEFGSQFLLHMSLVGDKPKFPIFSFYLCYFVRSSLMFHKISRLHCLSAVSTVLICDASSHFSS
jgi:hypothetical protein